MVLSNHDSHETQPRPADTSDHSDIEPLSRDLQEIQTEVCSDQTGENFLPENSEYNEASADVEPNSNVGDGSPILELESEDSLNTQETTATNDERDHASLQSSSEEVSRIELGAQNSNTAESLSLLRTLDPLAHLAAKDNEVSLHGTSVGHDQIQDEIDTKGTAHAESSQHIQNSHPEHSADTDHVQQNLSDTVRESNGHTNGTLQPSSRIRPLPDISDAPNPYTEEEMESYERWRQDSTTGAQEQRTKALDKEKEPRPPQENNIERPVQTCHIGTATKTPAEKRSTTASQEMPLLLPVASFIFLLFFAILVYLNQATMDH